jgi:hypothetical protein
MSLEQFSPQTTHEAPSASMRERKERFIAPALLPVRCICGLVRDESESSSGFERWVPKRTYQERHDVNPTEIPLTHTYCPDCVTKAQNTIRQYFREIGTSS